jgi:hypothetical protein
MNTARLATVAMVIASAFVACAKAPTDAQKLKDALLTTASAAGH